MFLIMKKPISATIDDKLIKWLDEVLSKDAHYRNKSHVIELALQDFKSKFDSKKQ